IHGDNRLAITTFGKGNDAEIALQSDVKGNEIKDKLPIKVGGGNVHTIVPNIDVKGRDNQGNPLNALLNNPAEHAIEDYLKLKPQLEKEFFGKEFPNDNIRIQIIYNILDIQKLLGIYITDVIYTINNLQELPPDTPLEETDIVGLAMNDDKKINERLKRIIPYMGFFGEAFQVPPRPEKNKQEQIKNQDKIDSANRHNVSALRILGAMRQVTAHFKDSYLIFRKNDKLPKTFQKHNDKGNAIVRDDWTIVDQLYRMRITNINDGFMNKSEVNLCTLFKMLNAIRDEEKEEIACEYYAFSILKEGKNLGVNMKLLRETMIDKHYESIKQEKHDSYRSKIYVITDYLLFRELHHSEELEKMVSELRKTSNEDEKKNLYLDFAHKAWDKTQAILLPFYEKFDGTFILHELSDLDQRFIQNVQLKTETELSLVKLLSFLCNFWSGKEINELLSAYIHKFENIQVFINTLKKLKEPIKFTDKYGLFNEYGNNNAGNIAKQLRAIVSIGKMKPNLNKENKENKENKANKNNKENKNKEEKPNLKRQLYKAAITMLGAPDLYVSDKWLEENVLTGDESKKKDCNPFRNFIAKQVIESTRFQYLVRYAPPKTVRALMSNPNIVRYVLRRNGNLQTEHIHESQINKYYKNLPEYNEQEISFDEKVDALTKYLTNFSFNNIESQRKFIVNKKEDRNKAIEKLKALTRLYLSVAFAAIKNLVKTNARYYIAFAAFDRDMHLFEKKDKEDKEKRELKDNPIFEPEISGFKNYFAITEYFLNKDDNVRYIPDPKLPDAENKKALFKFIDTRAGKWHFTKKWNIILRNNIAEAKKIHETGLLLTAARNDTEHLNILFALPQYVAEFHTDNKPMQSYFELYHFILQKWTCRPEWFNEKTQKYFPNPLSLGDLPNNLEKHHTPSHNWIKYAFVSLAYNLPRYKNLTIEALFDKDSESGKKLDEERKWKEDEKNNKRNN
ncbi:MAG: type VI-D CRISPR-associated RNA-guided ribonuclease Cas13d, partial [Planctomycetaceae bacterium]|nr:type VI-D CRISPR-associated RNA-guided ribonuclease Cas13d [Planctomycetaceae bacterium]